ncbi:MAG: sulfatase-like hydrolase/transferase, partial [Planctomycetales bacterium]|nr:sulfatase-like hydrolase/transferase [Planctomycetales bacterium]
MRFVQLTALLAFLMPLSAMAADASRPNVVMIISDDQAWTDYGFMGHPAIKTPNLDKLARESATFTRGYVPSSLCRPSLATMVTGLFPHENGITGNDPPKGTDRMLMVKHIRACDTLPRLLAKRGYRSLQTGKWWEGDPVADGGFTHAMTHGDPKRGGRHGDLGLKIGREGLAPIGKFLDDCGDNPFFIWYAPFLPHSPHNPPARLLEKY